MSSRSEGEPFETRSGPRIEGIPPGSDVPLGWGTIEDDGGAPSVLEVPDAPKGSVQARAPALYFYDIEMFKYRQ